MIYVGVDVGGSGSRLLVAKDDAAVFELKGPGATSNQAGSDIAEVVTNLLDQAKTPADSTIAVGATGLASLVSDPTSMANFLHDRFSSAVVLATDAVTAHLGALAGQPGCVTALGTGAISVCWDGEKTWRRMDGWGHLLGDRGGGAWIGLRALQLAMAAYDGVLVAGKDLLAAAIETFGEPPTWPALLQQNPGRAGLLASFVPQVTKLADAGDLLASDLIRRAGYEAASTAVALGRVGFTHTFALTGGLAKIPQITASYNETLLMEFPDARIVNAAGDPLLGSMRLARRFVKPNLITSVPGFIWINT